MNNLKELQNGISIVLDNDEITLNDAGGVSIKPHGWHWTAYTIYPKSLVSFVVYAAHPDISRGIDCSDEKQLMEGNLFAVQSFLRGALNRPVPDEILDRYLGKKVAEKFFAGIEIGYRMKEGL